MPFWLLFNNETALHPKMKDQTTIERTKLFCLFHLKFFTLTPIFKIFIGTHFYILKSFLTYKNKHFYAQTLFEKTSSVWGFVVFVCVNHLIWEVHVLRPSDFDARRDFKSFFTDCIYGPPNLPSCGFISKCF